MLSIAFLQQQDVHWLQIVVWLAAIITLGVTAWQIRSNKRTNQAKFWLDLRQMFAKHNEVHRKLRRKGEWTQPGNEEEPAIGTNGEADLIAYMGLFEHCEYMLQKKLIDKKTFKKIYAYRLNALLRNNRVKQKLARYNLQSKAFEKYRSWDEDAEGGWNAFKSLLKRCNKLDMLERPLRATQKPSSEPPTPTLTVKEKQTVTNYAKKLQVTRFAKKLQENSKPR